MRPGWWHQLQVLEEWCRTSVSNRVRFCPAHTYNMTTHMRWCMKTSHGLCDVRHRTTWAVLISPLWFIHSSSQMPTPKRQSALHVQRRWNQVNLELRKDDNLTSYHEKKKVWHSGCKKKFISGSTEKSRKPIKANFWHHDLICALRHTLTATVSHFCL